MKNFISVILTSYNYETYIKQTLESLVTQTNQNFEIIVINDGSTDGSLPIIHTFVKKYPHIHLLQHSHGQNRGLIASVQLALKNCRGNYIAFCESDDYWHPSHLGKLYSFLAKHPEAKILFNTVYCINLSSHNAYDTFVE